MHKLLLVLGKGFEPSYRNIFILRNCRLPSVLHSFLPPSARLWFYKLVCAVTTEMVRKLFLPGILYLYGIKGLEDAPFLPGYPKVGSCEGFFVSFRDAIQPLLQAAYLRVSSHIFSLKCPAHDRAIAGL